MIITQNDYLKETIAADSLKAAQETKPTTTAAARALEIFMKLAPEQQKLHLDFLEKSLNDGDNDVWKKATDYSERNRASLKDAQKTKTMPTLKKEELEELIAESFPEFSPELQNKFAELFTSSVGAILRQKILELFVDNPEFALVFDDESMDYVERLLLRISQLEDDIADVEEENEMLEAGLVESRQRLSEEALFAPSNNTKAKRRSLDFDDYIDEGNAVLMETDGQHIGDPQMRKRVEYMQRIADINGQPRAKNDLMEAWKMNQSN